MVSWANHSHLMLEVWGKKGESVITVIVLYQGRAMVRYGFLDPGLCEVQLRADPGSLCVTTECGVQWPWVGFVWGWTHQWGWVATDHAQHTMLSGITFIYLSQLLVDKAAAGHLYIHSQPGKQTFPSQPSSISATFIARILLSCAKTSSNSPDN